MCVYIYIYIYIAGELGQKPSSTALEMALSGSIYSLAPKMANLKLSSPIQKGLSDDALCEKKYTWRKKTLLVGRGSGGVSAYLCQPDDIVFKKPESRKELPKDKSTGAKLLHSVVPNEFTRDNIKDCVKLISKTIVHFSMLFNVLLMDLCDQIGLDDSLDHEWNRILFGDDIYETCLKFVLIPQYRQTVKPDEMNCYYLDHFNVLIQQYFGCDFPSCFNVVDKCHYNILKYNIIGHYRQRFLNVLRNTYYKRQRQCVECFVKFLYPHQSGKRLVQYITNRINGKYDFMSQFDRDINIAKFVFDHQKYIYGLKRSNIQYQPFRVVRYFYFLSRYMGALKSKAEFNLAPLSKISLKFIDINNEVIANMWGLSTPTSRHSISNICSGIPQKCKKIITDGDVAYYDNQKGKTSISHRLPQNNIPNLEQLYNCISLKSVEIFRWKLFIARYLQIYDEIWNSM